MGCCKSKSAELNSPLNENRPKSSSVSLQTKDNSKAVSTKPVQTNSSSSVISTIREELHRQEVQNVAFELKIPDRLPSAEPSPSSSPSKIHQQQIFSPHRLSEHAIVVLEPVKVAAAETMDDDNVSHISTLPNTILSPVRFATPKIGKYSRSSSETKQEEAREVRQTPLVPEPKSGFMRKQGQRLHTFHERFFVLKDGVLSNFSSEKDSHNAAVIESREAHNKQIHLKGFNLLVQTNLQHLVLEGEGFCKHVLEVPKKLQFTLWAEALKQHIAYANGYYHLVAAESSKMDKTAPV